jgi:FRG domain
MEQKFQKAASRLRDPRPFVIIGMFEMRPKSAVGAPKGHSAENLTQFLDVVRKIRVRWSSGTFTTVKAGARILWFRGQQNANWGLQPKLLRPEFTAAAQPESEAEIRQEFQSRALQMIQGRLPADKWEWYFLMQHYGAPTRLLDWTDSPLIALFFALHEHPGDRDAAVWMLDPWWLNQKLRKGIDGPMESDWEEAQPYLLDIEEAFGGGEGGPTVPAAIEPPHVDRRLAVQRSHFVIFGKTKDLARTRAAREPIRTRRLVRILIPSISIKAIYEELENAGVTMSMLFPDLEHLSKELCAKWRFTP